MFSKVIRLALRLPSLHRRHRGVRMLSGWLGPLSVCSVIRGHFRGEGITPDFAVKGPATFLHLKKRL